MRRSVAPGEVLGADLVEELGELLDLALDGLLVGRLVVVLLEQDAGLLQHAFLGEDRHRLRGAHGQRDGVGGARGDAGGAVTADELISAKKVLSRISVMITWERRAPVSSRTVLKRSWVIGRGVSMPWSV